MARMLLSLAIPPGAQAQLTSLLSQQQDPKSPIFHQWLTPEAFGARFGPGQQDLDSVLAWLQENGFTVEQVSAGRLRHHL
jgi:subtilase family serine protease